MIAGTIESPGQHSRLVTTVSMALNTSLTLGALFLLNLPDPSDPARTFSVPYTTAGSTFIPGVRSVTSALHAKRRNYYKLYYTETARTSGGGSSALQLAAKAHIPRSLVDQSYINAILTKLSSSDKLISDVFLHTGRSIIWNRCVTDLA